VERAPFVFVVGCARSGTTLLRVMLDRHPLMAIPPESHFLVPLWRWRRRYDRDGGFDLDRWRKDLLTFYRFRDWGLALDLVEDRLSGLKTIDFSEAVRRVYALYAEASKKPRYGDKTPPYLLRMPLIAQLFPEARFLHIVRDGRDVAASLVEQMGHPRLSEAADYWGYRILAARRTGSALGPERYREVRYERLVQDPEGELAWIAAFLDLPPDARTAETRGGLGRLPPAKRARHPHLAERPTAGLRDWRRDLAPEQVATVEALAGDALDLLGYERRFEHLPPNVRRRAPFQHLVNQARWFINRRRRDLKLARHRLRLQ
jgi:Sulfotransferase family